MKDSQSQNESFPLVAPVQLKALQDDAVSHSLAILSTVYNYNHWIFQSFRDYLGPTILEVGAGVGNITQFLLNAERVACLEPFEPYHKYLETRFRKHLNVEVYPHPIEDCPNGELHPQSFDSVICLNVLEHIEQDVEALRHMKQLLNPGGTAIVLVPALPWLFGQMDKSNLYGSRMLIMEWGLAQRQ